MGKVLTISLLLMLILPPNVSALNSQEPGEMKEWQVRGAARGAMRVGDMAQASAFLAEWHRRQPSNKRVKTELAHALYATREYQHAMELFYSIYNDNPRANIGALYYYAMILKKFGEHERALGYLGITHRRHRALTGGNINRDRVERAMEGCRMALRARDSLTLGATRNLGPAVNCSGIQFGPMFISENEFLYGSTFEGAPGFIYLDEPYHAARGFFRAKYQDGEWHGTPEIEKPFENITGRDTGRGVFSPDGQRFYSTRCFINHNGKSICHLYMAQLVNGEWTEGVKLCRAVNHPRFTSTQPAIGTSFSNRFEVLYFVSDRPGGAGGKDIWYSVFDRHAGTHRDAENAGVFINTPQNEVTPFYDIPSRRLFFSSDGWPGHGGFDIFFSTGHMVTWEQPVNAGLPLNSTFDDIDYTRDRRGRIALLVSNRDGHPAIGGCPRNDDLFESRDKELARVRVSGQFIAREITGEVLATATPARGYQQEAVPVVMSNTPLSVQLNVEGQPALFVEEIMTDSEGRFEVYVDPGHDYTINVEHPNLLNNNLLISSRDTNRDDTINLNTVILDIAPVDAIIIENIFYEFDQAELTAASKLALDSTLLVLLVTYPRLRVEISAHTDNIGSARYNLELSRRRAHNVVEYLVQKGICRSRLTASGHGHLKPLAPNQHPDGSDNPEGRKINRRTEFKITGFN